MENEGKLGAAAGLTRLYCDAKLQLRGRLKEMARSGAIEWSLDDLKLSRSRREKTQSTEDRK